MSAPCPCKNKGKSLSLVLKIALFAVAVCVIVLISVCVVNLIVKGSVADKIYDTPANLTVDGKVDCIVILGAGLQSNGQPSHMLEDRIKTGVEVFKAVDAGFILMSGDCSGEHYDEPAAMKKYAMALGVDEDKILLDGQGFSTFESISRVNEEYGFENVVIITQKYHLYRALYIAAQYEIEAFGVSADLRTYRGQIYRDLREVLARVKDYIKAK